MTGTITSTFQGRPADGRDPLHAEPSNPPSQGWIDNIPPEAEWDGLVSAWGLTALPATSRDGFGAGEQGPVAASTPSRDEAGLAGGDPAPGPLVPADDGAAVSQAATDMPVAAALLAPADDTVVSATTITTDPSAGPVSSEANTAGSGGYSTVPASGNPYIDGMVGGTKWSSLNLTYSFPQTTSAYLSYPSGSGDLFQFAPANTQQANSERAILEGIPNTGVTTYGFYESFTNLNFTESTGTDVGTANLRLAISGNVSTAKAYFPQNFTGAGDIWLGRTYFGAGQPYSTGQLPGSYGYQTLLHETGHALGLKHPHDTSGGLTGLPTLPTDMDSLEFTVMSYRSYIGASTTGGYTNETFSYPTTPMMLDIQALQYLYGADYSTNATDTTYKWNPATGEMSLNGAGQGAPGSDQFDGNHVFMTVWDGGGRDTYDMSNYTNGVSVDLRPGKWSVNSKDQLAILQSTVVGAEIRARGTVFNALLYNNDTRSLIEDAIGGIGNDTLVGNQAANVLTGNGGNDSILGDLASETTPGGNDTLYGGDGNDWLDGGKDDDLVYGDAGNDTIQGGTGNDTLFSGTGNDSLNAGDGNDKASWLTGDGNDTFLGGSGNDTLSLQGWTGPRTGTDSILNGIYGSWVVSGSAADRIFANGSTTIHATSWETIMCFAAGTRIATARGEVAVEALRVGDLVVTPGGGAPLQPVTWLGHVWTEVARHPDRAAVAPVRVKAGALGDGIPFRDLRVSPDHAIHLDGCLVPARLLVNGTTIVQELWCPRVDYWHVELPRHGLLLSEGAATESYLDDGNRRHFDRGPVAALFPDFESERANGIYDSNACRPVLRHGLALEAIRNRLDRRAGEAPVLKIG